MIHNEQNEEHRKLFHAIALQTLDLGMSPEQAAGFILSEEHHGALRLNAPTWIQRSTAFRIARGEGPSMLRLDDLTRIMTALHELESLRDAAVALDGF